MKVMEASTKRVELSMEDSITASTQKLMVRDAVLLCYGIGWRSRNIMVWCCVNFVLTTVRCYGVTLGSP